MTRDPIENRILALLTSRAPAATVCPSEVARALAVGTSDSMAWRAQMPQVHATIDRLLARGTVRLSWKGVPLAKREGAYRIARPDPDASTD